MSAAGLAIVDCSSCFGGMERRLGSIASTGLYREEGLSGRKRKGRRHAVGTRASILVEAKANARWSLDFHHDQFACGRRFRILNVVDDVTRECLAAMWKLRVPPVAPTAPSGVSKTADALIAAG